MSKFWQAPFGKAPFGNESGIRDHQVRTDGRVANRLQMNTLRAILERHAACGEVLSLERFVPDRRDSPEDELIENVYTLIKGSPKSLRFLGELLIEFADGDHGTAFDIHQQGAGSVHFNCEKKLGIYLVKSGDG